MRPPSIARFLMRVSSAPEDREFILHDLDARFEDTARANGARAAKRWYWLQVLKVLPWAIQSILVARPADGVAAVLQDIRYTLRQMRRAPAFTAVVLLTIAVGVGLNVTVFSGVHELILREIPHVVEPSRLVHVYRSWPGIEFGSSSIPHFRDLRERGDDVFEDVAAWSFVRLGLETEAQSDVLTAQMVSANFFDLLGVRAALGRTFLPDEGREPGSDPVVVLSHDTWTTRFGGDRDVLSRSLVINGLPFQVVGVAPEGFRGVRTAYAPALWAPLSMQPRLQPGREDRATNRDSNFMNVLARMRPGASLATTRTAAEAILERLEEAYPETYAGSGIRIVPFAGGGLGPASGRKPVQIAMLLSGFVALLLLLACANVANLFVARADRRSDEIAVRVSIGAGRGRLLRQMMTESVVFGVLGSLLGVALASAAIRAISRIRPAGSSLDLDLGVSGPVLLFSFGITLVAVLSFGLAPSLRAARPIDTGSRSSPSSRLTPALVTIQVALSVILLAGAVLFARSLWTATRIDLGFDASRLLAADLHPDLVGYDQQATEALLRDVATAMEATPDVERVSWADGLPLDLSGQSGRVEVPGYDPAPGEQTSLAFARVGPGYFETMGIPIVRGRGITARDGADAADVLVVNETMAERYWPGEDPLGRVVVTQGAERTVVGVAKDARYESLDEGPTAFLYLSLAQDFRATLSLIVRTQGGPGDVAAGVRRVVHDADPSLPLRDVRTMEENLGGILLPSRVVTAALSLFGTIGLLLSTLGIYGVLSHAVGRRAREIGIRVAIGASPDRVLRGILSQGARLVVAGVALGLVLALPAVHLVRGLLYAPQALDPVAFVGVPAFLSLLALAAVWIPARRAARISPATMLKGE